MRSETTVIIDPSSAQPIVTTWGEFLQSNLDTIDGGTIAAILNEPKQLHTFGGGAAGIYEITTGETGCPCPTCRALHELIAASIDAYQALLAAYNSDLDADPSALPPPVLESLPVEIIRAATVAR